MACWSDVSARASCFHLLPGLQVYYSMYGHIFQLVKKVCLCCCVCCLAVNDCSLGHQQTGLVGVDVTIVRVLSGGGRPQGSRRHRQSGPGERIVAVAGVYAASLVSELTPVSELTYIPPAGARDAARGSAGQDARSSQAGQCGPQCCIFVRERSAEQSTLAGQDIPIAKVSDLEEADGFIFATPTRFGNVTAQFKTFWDSTGQLWMKGALHGKPFSMISGSASQARPCTDWAASFHRVLC